MGQTIVVEIEHTQFARLMEVKNRAEGSLPVTTLADNQTKALFRLYLTDESGRKLLHQFTISGIPPRPAGSPRLHLYSRMEGRHTVRIAVTGESGTAYDRTVDLRQILPARRYRWIIPLVIVILGGAAAAFVLLRPPDSGLKRTVTVSRGKAGEEQRGSLPEGREPEAPGPEEEETIEGPVPDEETLPEGPGAGTGEAPATEAAAETAGRQDEEAAPGEELPGSDAALSPDIEETVYFRPESAVLLSAARLTLDALLPELEKHPRVPFLIEGHCAPFGTEASRFWLSEERARTVYEYLTASGWDPDVPPRIVGRGSTLPVTADPEEQQLNRRVEIRTGEELQR